LNRESEQPSPIKGETTDHQGDAVRESPSTHLRLLPDVHEQVPHQYISRNDGNPDNRDNRHLLAMTNVYAEIAGNPRGLDAGVQEEGKPPKQEAYPEKPLAEVDHKSNDLPKQNDMPIDGETRHKVIDGVLQQIKDRYVGRDASPKFEELLRSREAGAYSQITSTKQFAETLTRDLQSVTRDKHMKVKYNENVLPDDLSKPPPEYVAHALEQQEREHSGIETVKTLPGNIGYLKINNFPPSGSDADPRGAKMVSREVDSAMAALANTDALIVDLTKNKGGDPSTVLRNMDYLFDKGTNVNNIRWREGASERTEAFVTSDPAGQRYGATKPIYVLTSSDTFSGGEEFAYDLQSRGRAVVIGTTTAGAANPTELFRLTDHLAMAVPIGSSVNPVTGTNWEATEGVHPDREVPAASALDVAQTMALNQLAQRRNR